MTILADFPFDSNVIVVLVAVIFAAIKAFLERGKSEESVEETGEDEELYEQYEAELQRQREALEFSAPIVRPVEAFRPPPIPSAPKPIKPSLSAAEKEALENLQLRSRRSRKKRSDQSTKRRIYRHLASPTAAREALLLAEILGPPKALKDHQ